MISALAGSVFLLLLTAGNLLADPPAKKRLALVPFQLERTEGSALVRCRACGNVMKAGVIEGDPAETLTRIAWDLLTEQEREYEFISPGQVEGVYQSLLAKKIDTDSLPMMKALGQALKVDGIIWGEVFRYEDRKGTAYAADRPASIALDLHLLRVSDGALVWKAQWSETQQALSENLFQIGEVARRGLRWMTAEQLARSGLKHMIKDFPGPGLLP
ncbi:MAG: hypothetical protein HY892_10835 [Deltaproteobacteria bacterium]|nr:hypothetical protein [Deltaproteobacteria bacterium]